MNGSAAKEEQAMQDAADIRAAGGIGAKMSISGHRQEVADLETPGAGHHEEPPMPP